MRQNGKAMDAETQILALPVALQRRRRQEAMQILRLGSAANAIVSMWRASHALGNPRADINKSEADTRRKEIDRIHVSAMDALLKAQQLLIQLAFLATAGLVAELALNWDDCIKVKK
jgi:hypothetical protein